MSKRKVPAGFDLVDEEWRAEVYRKDQNGRWFLVGTVDKFAKAAYIEGQPSRSRYVGSLDDGIRYIVDLVR